ncbi:hypothetical protein EU244_029800 [Rhodococcus qingshengii]|uniref:hypothetical protein n=1 Tax=Rhodococcus qingshengii TaxID=334542 RepID=UPI0010A5D2B6|nr:hypothetical protein [Rhodococcus qingshengii]THJ66642.1 hypothetical protein EU244_27745 [Rhodococcus qingshengii]
MTNLLPVVALGAAVALGSVSGLLITRGRPITAFVVFVAATTLGIATLSALVPDSSAPGIWVALPVIIAAMWRIDPNDKRPRLRMSVRQF